MRKAMGTALLFGIVLVLSAGPAMAAKMYAKKDQVKVTEQKSPMSRVVATLRMGDPVQVLVKSGRHYKVLVSSGKKGWVFKYKLSTKPVERSAGSGDALAMLSGQSTVSARESRSGGSIRGLEEAAEAYVKHKRIDPAHKESVERMERRGIPEDRLLRFQQQGSVGEFSGGGQ